MPFFEGSNSEKTIIVKAESQEEAIAKINSVLGKETFNEADVFEVKVLAILGHTREYYINDNQYFELKTLKEERK